MALPNMRQVYIFLGMILFFNIKLSIQECSQHDLQRPYPHDLQRPYVEVDPIEAAQNGQPVILFNPAYKEWLFVSGDKIKDDNIVESGCWNGADPQRLHFILSPAGNGKLFMKSPSKGKYMFVALHDKKGKDHMVEAQYKKIDRSIFEFRNQSDGSYHIYNSFKKHNVFVSNDLWNGDNLALSHPTHHIEERNKFRVQLPGTIKVEKVEYNLDAAKKETVTPVVIATQKVHGGRSQSQSQTFEFEKGLEEESSFNHEAGIELSASAEFQAGAPLVTSATYTLGISASYTHSWGKSTTETSNVRGSFPIIAPPNTTVVATATMQKTKLDVPYKITLRTSEGKVFYNHGTWKGVSHWGLQSTFKEYPLHQEPSHEESIVTKNNLLCGENEKHWVKVRHVPQSSGGWHPVNDNLMGTAEYGNPNNDDEPWSIKWNLSDFDEFLFASGNMKYWMRATKNDIIGNDGLKLYANEDIKIISSSRSCSPYTAKMYKRKTNDEDPWLSLRDHWDSPNDVMYGENSNIGHNHVRDHNDGMDVYIRKF